MPVKNATKKTIVGKNARVLGGILPKFIGLMFSKKTGNALIFRFKKERIISLHMLFVFYPIDVLFLGKNMAVVDKKENFRPFSFYSSKKMAMYAVELPEGAIKKTKTEAGDRIVF